MRTIQLAIAAATVGGMIAPAAAAPILPGNFTELTVTWSPLLAQAGLTQGLSGTATGVFNNGLPAAVLPITGGFTNPDGTAQIDHVGSGITLGNGAIVSDLQNLVVDTSANIVLADVVVNGVSVTPVAIPEFNIGTGNVWTLTAQSAAAIDTLFGTTLFTGSTVVGTAVSDPIRGRDRGSRASDVCAAGARRGRNLRAAPPHGVILAFQGAKAIRDGHGTRSLRWARLGLTDGSEQAA